MTGHFSLVEPGEGFGIAELSVSFESEQADVTKWTALHRVGLLQHALLDPGVVGAAGLDHVGLEELMEMVLTETVGKLDEPLATVSINLDGEPVGRTTFNYRGVDFLFDDVTVDRHDYFACWRLPTASARPWPDVVTSREPSA